MKVKLKLDDNLALKRTLDLYAIVGTFVFIDGKK